MDHRHHLPPHHHLPHPRHPGCPPLHRYPRHLGCLHHPGDPGYHHDPGHRYRHRCRNILSLTC